MKVEFVPNMEGKDMAELCGVSEHRYDKELWPKMQVFLEKYVEEDDYETDKLLCDFLALAETPGEFALLAFQAGRKAEEFDAMYNNPLMDAIANAINQ